MTVTAPPLVLAIDPTNREGREGEAKRGRLRRGAILAAALIHAAVIAALLLRWPFTLTPPAPEKPPITVALVTEPAPPPPPPAQTKPPTPAPAAQHFLMSGKDQDTTAPPQAEVEGPVAAPKPPPLPEQKQADAPSTAQPKLTPPAPPKAKEAERETAPQTRKQGSVNRAPGETEQEGDPYLNRLWSMIEQNRAYPTGAVGSLGLNIEGTVTYLIGITSAGALERMQLQRSSGATALDETARKMIEKAAPFPPLPSYYPRNGVVLVVTIHLFPTAS